MRYEYQTPYNDIYNNLADFNVATGKFLKLGEQDHESEQCGRQ